MNNVKSNLKKESPKFYFVYISFKREVHCGKSDQSNKSLNLSSLRYFNNRFNFT